MKYDYIIVGTGLFGSVCAYELFKQGKKILVVEKRNHIGGNCYTENIDGINVHVYGAHIFHTNKKEIWNYVNSFVDFDPFLYRAKNYCQGKIYSFPINLMTLQQLYNITTPVEAEQFFKNIRKDKSDDNFESYLIDNIGEQLYKVFYEEYMIKQWGVKSGKDLPSFIAKRIPIRFNYDDNYYNDLYQGMPVDGYTKMFEAMLKNIPLILNVDFLDYMDELIKISNKIIYTGEIDRLLEYTYGNLEYRSIIFKNEMHKIKDFQGNCVINYSDLQIPYVRIIEHKHFGRKKVDDTIISYQYSCEHDKTNIPYYPINNDTNNLRYKKYLELLKEKYPSIIVGGRLGEYKYYDMTDIIERALECVKKL